MILLTLNDFALQKHLASVTFKQVEMPVQHFGAHYHEYYEIEVILEGATQYIIDGITHEGTAGDLFMLKPSSFHDTAFFEGTKFITIMFPLNAGNLDFLSSLPADKSYIALHLSDTDTNLIRILAQELETCMSKNPSADNPYATSILNCILGKIASLTDAQNISKSTSAMSRAILYIQNHFTEDITLNQVAAVANYSSNYFSTQFKQLTGMSFKQYLTNTRYTFAKKLLRTTNSPVSDICHQCGFNDFSHFLTAFKNRYGMTPKQFRTNMQQKTEAKS